jgi:MFS family permease
VRRFYYGWLVVAMSTFIYLVVVGASFGVYSLYVLPVSKEFHLSRAEVNTGLILMNLGNAVLSPFIGWILDRVSVKKVMVVSTLIFGLSFVILSQSRSLWLSAAVLALGIPASYLGVGSISLCVLIGRWFVANRGRALALAGVGIFLGSLVIAPAVSWLIVAQGWRAALLATGLVFTALLLPIGLFVRARPGPGDVEPGADAALAAAEPDRPAAVGEILGAPAFWTSTLAITIGFAVIQALVVSLVPFARQSGLTMLEATSLVSATGVGAIVASLLVAIVADRMDRVLMVTGMLLAGAVMNLALLTGGGYPLLLGCAALMGASTASIAPVYYALLADRFGGASFGTVRGLMMPLVAGGAMVSVRAAGEVFDRTGGYGLLFQAFIVLELVAAALMFATRFDRPRVPARA